MMLGFLLQVQTGTPPASIRKEVHLTHHQVLKVETWGGERPGKSIITLDQDGTLTVRELNRGSAVKPVIKKLSKDEVADLEMHVQAADFEKLWSLPKATIDPKSLDGVDELYVMRQGKRVVWWSNAVYQTSNLEASLVNYIWSVIHS